jgi:hypothetical protein
LYGAVLFVGVREYNRGYHLLVPEPARFETVDVDEKQARYGAPVHHIGTASCLVSDGRRFEHVVLYGLFGMKDSVLSGEAITAFLSSMQVAVVPGGTLLYGASTDTMSVAEARERFDMAGFSGWHELADRLIRPSKAHSEMVIRWVRCPCATS